MTHRNERGSALVVSLLVLTVLMTMAMAFTHEARSQSVFNAGTKLSQFYKIAAQNIMLEACNNMEEHWVSANRQSSGQPGVWRLGGLMGAPGDADETDWGWLYASSFPADSLGDAPETANAGLITLNYRIYVQNNRDDPAYFLSGLDINGHTMDRTWDTDGKVALTVQVFDGQSERPGNPLVSLTAVVQPSGMEALILAGHDAPTTSGDKYAGLGSGEGEADVDNSVLTLENFNPGP